MNSMLTALHFGLIGFAVLWPVVLLVVRGRPLVTGVVTLYATLALAVVLLPLPGPDTPRPSQTVQLVPFQWVLDTLGGDLNAAKGVVLNVLLFVPLGVFARTLLRRSRRTTVLLGLAASLAVEVTQLTANFGTAPFAYRIFDVDDLMTNTLGAAVGWLVANAVVGALRTRVAVPRATVRQPAPAR
jgi:glycopeptide antibiotics resistance protein